MEEVILKELKKLIKGDFKLETPQDRKFGDYSLPCFNLAKQFKKNPNETAKDIRSKLKLDMKIEVVGGYLNFFLDDKKVIKDVLSKILKEGSKYGSTNIGKRKKVVIDFSSPNIAKPFGIGHLRSTVIGNSLYNILTFLGYKCIGVNHLGDWGTQFGKLIVAYNKWGDPKKIKKQSIVHLFSIYVKFHQQAKINPELDDEAREWFKKLEQGDKKATKLWKWFKDLSLKEFQKYYKELNIKFDSYHGEAFYNKKLNDTIKKFKKHSVIDDGALVIPFKDMPPIILKKRDGASTYHTRDLATLFYRIKTYDPIKILYVVGSPQNLHFKQLFKGFHLVNKKSELVHVNFGLMKFKDGNMSTRKGNIIFLEDVLDKSTQYALKLIKEKSPRLKNKEKVAKQIGIGSIVFGDLINDRLRDLVFDWNKILDFNGETGPYVQYGYVRTNSLLKKGRFSTKIKFDLLNEKEEIELIKLLNEFPDLVLDSGKQYKPSIVAKYLIDVVRSFNHFYEKHQVLVDDKYLKNARLGLIKAVNIVLENGMRLLGLKVVKEM